MNKPVNPNLMKNPGVSRAVMRELDRKAIEEYEIPGMLLMENAGRNVAEVVMETLEKNSGEKVAIICGKGNNGGDGYVIARHLYNAGYEVLVYLLTKVDDIAGDGDAGLNLKILQNMGIKINEVLDNDGINLMINRIADCGIIVDSIFGTGLKGELREPARTVINRINELDANVIAVDIPSGLDCDEGKVLGACVVADKTVTFAVPKKGFFVEAGPEHVGELVVTGISIPADLIDNSRKG